MIILRHLLCCQFLSPWFGLVGWQLGLLRQLPSQASTFIHAPPKVKVWRSKQCKFSTKANCQHELPSFNPLCFDFRQSQISTLNHKGELVCFGVEIWNFVPKIWNYCVFGVSWKWCWCQHNDKYHVWLLHLKIKKYLEITIMQVWKWLVMVASVRVKVSSHLSHFDNWWIKILPEKKESRKWQFWPKEIGSDPKSGNALKFCTDVANNRKFNVLLS